MPSRPHSGWDMPASRSSAVNMDERSENPQDVILEIFLLGNLRICQLTMGRSRFNSGTGTRAT